jgi:hypothetical protein
MEGTSGSSSYLIAFHDFTSDKEVNELYDKYSSEYEEV